MITRILKWFNSLPRREQWLLFCAAGLVLVLLLVQGLWRPLARENARLDARNQESVETLAWMLRSADEVIELRASGAGPSSRSTGPMSAEINAAARRHGVLINSLRPSGQNEARIVIEKVSFASVMAWLYELESSKGINARSLSLSGAGESGLVSLQGHLVRGG